MKMTSYDINTEYEALRALTVEEFDEETGELIDNSEEIKALLAELDLKRDDKLKGIEYIKREYLAMIEAIKSEKKRLDDRKNAFERTVDRLKDLQDMLLGGEKVETDIFTFSYRKSTSLDTSGVNIDAIGTRYKETTKVTKLLNSEIKKALQDGEEIKGAELVVKKNLQVK